MNDQTSTSGAGGGHSANRTTQSVGTLLILGASGDLASRLLMPALGQLLARQPERTLHLIGAGTEDWDDEKWRKVVTDAFASADVDLDAVGDLIADTRYLSADVTDHDALRSLIDACTDTPAIYFALPPAVTAAACAALTADDLPDGTQLALEKPFGTDHDSAVELNRRVLTLVPESQIHRIDHFLGNSTVLNLLGLRFANRVLEPLWNADHIASIEIVYDETLALEGRARYYDKAGALVDMIQSHLLQVMSVVAMEPPASLGERDVRDAKGTVLRATHLWDDDARTSSRRGRYTAGSVDGHALPSYVDEAGVDPALHTETLAEVTVEVANWRWAGVPITLRSGKALGVDRHEIVVTFHAAPHVPVGLTGVERPTILRLRLGPDAMSLDLNVNGPGDPYEIGRASLEAEFGPGQLLAYGEVLEGLLDADPTLSVRGDAAEECWRILTPVLAAWRADDVPLDDYPAGSSGPEDWPGDA